MECRSKNGFTLVELLVVITIIGILIALLLPAVQAAREAARRMQCQNNIKQVGLAVLNYESQNKIFPPSSCWPSGGASINSAAIYNNYQANWVIMILPFLDQQALYDKFDLTQPISGNANAAARAVQLQTMLCPSDSFNRKAFMGSDNPATQAFGDNWARGNYAANAAIGQMDYSSGTYSAATPNSGYWKASYIRGMMGANCAVKMADIIDGTSNTVMLGEIRAGLVTFDSRGVWAMSGGSSALWGTGGFVGDDYGPNCLQPGADDIIAGDAVASACGGSNALIAEKMPCYINPSNDQVTARSLHPDGVNTCFADGSVHWLSDYIQARAFPLSSSNLSVWDRLMCSADGNVVNGNSY